MKFKQLSQVTTGGLMFAALAGIPAIAQSAPPDRPAPPVPPVTADATPAQTIEGMVDGFNRDPRGQVNSIQVKTSDGKLYQFNLPPDLGDVALHIAADGQRVSVVGSPERTVGDRTIFRLSKLTGADGKSSLTAPTPGMPEPTETIEGTVRRLNFSPDGQVDGAMLDSGDYVHTGFEAGTGLIVGGKLSVTGLARPMSDSHRVVEADTVNGRPVPRPPVRPGSGPEVKARPHGVTPPAPPAPEAATPPVPPAPDAAAPAPPAPPAAR
jgi:hypothetical protein